MKLLKNEKRALEDVAFILIGLILMLVVPQFTLPLGGWFLFSFLVGAGLALVSVFDVLLAVENKSFPTFKRLRKNKSGVVWIWVGAISTLIMAAIVYFIATYPLDLIIQVITEDNGFHFSGVMGASFELCRQIVTWLLGFCVFGVILWMLVNANKRGADYPAMG